MKFSPLANTLRPKTLEEFVGQTHLVAKNKPLRKLIESKDLSASIILWGPPGCGKTTIARLMAKLTNSEFVEFSAVNSSKSDIQKVINKTRLLNKKIVLFLDEIHRFNKAQQDFLLPHVENGTITLIGATTENPSFEVISALLSRSRVFVLNPLTEEEIETILNNALKSPTLRQTKIEEENKKLISRLANGDARSALNILELAHSFTEPNKMLSQTSGAKGGTGQGRVSPSGDISGDEKASNLTPKREITKEAILEATQKSHLRYDKDGEEHYNIISALHKSMRDSDPDASIYWTMRMIQAGEDPKYIIRRMIRFASEDIGNADPQALTVATSAKQAVEFLGYPECDTALVQTAIYLALAPKSNSVYESTKKARTEIENSGNLPVPLHLRNAPTKLMKDLKYGKGYKYAHDYPEASVEQQHLPDKLEGKKFYVPKHEKEKPKTN